MGVSAWIFAALNPNFARWNRLRECRERLLPSRHWLLACLDRLLSSRQRLLACPERLLGWPERLRGSSERLLGSQERLLPSPERVLGRRLPATQFGYRLLKDNELKFATAGRRRQHARRARYPDFAPPDVSEDGAFLSRHRTPAE